MFVGMIVELMTEANTIRELQAANRKLRLENEQLSKHEVIEIIDNRVANEEAYHDYFKKF